MKLISVKGQMIDCTQLISTDCIARTKEGAYLWGQFTKMGGGEGGEGYEEIVRFIEVSPPHPHYLSTYNVLSWEIVLNMNIWQEAKLWWLVWNLKDDLSAKYIIQHISKSEGGLFT